MSLVVTYPLMKRITHWPQIVLGKDQKSPSENSIKPDKL